MKHLNTYKLFEANIKDDIYNYDLAADFYDKMIVELKNKNYIIQDDGNILFKGSIINEYYGNLLILFTSNSSTSTKPKFGDFKAGYALASYKNDKVIVLNNLSNESEVYQNISKSHFIHEFIHYLDSRRSNPKHINTKSYYNHPTEFNAYYQEGATFISKLLQDDKILSTFKSKYKTYDLFYKWVVDNALDKNFIENLNPKNIVKLKKRIYTIYAEFLAK